MREKYFFCQSHSNPPSDDHEDEAETSVPMSDSPPGRLHSRGGVSGDVGCLADSKGGGSGHGLARVRRDDRLSPHALSTEPCPLATNKKRLAEQYTVAHTHVWDVTLNRKGVRQGATPPLPTKPGIEGRTSLP